MGFRCKYSEFWQFFLGEVICQNRSQVCICNQSDFMNSGVYHCKYFYKLDLKFLHNVFSNRLLSEQIKKIVMSNQEPKIWVCWNRSNGKMSFCPPSIFHVRAVYKNHYSEILSCHTYKCATVTGLAELWCKPPKYWCSICWEKNLFLLAKVAAASNFWVT